MGNGAAVPKRVPHGLVKRYNELEKKCQSGFFFDHFPEYSSLLENAIVHDLLDCLEILLVSGDTRKASPVHIAAKHGKIEALDLLLCAGFPGDMKDKKGKLPMHYVCEIGSDEAILCLSLLIIRYPKCAKIYDTEGYTPIHTAILADNVKALKTMFSQNINIDTVPTSSGFRPVDLAKRNQMLKALEYLQTKDNVATSSKEIIRNREIDEKRIMAVWERFFENAFQHSGLDAFSEYSDNENYNSKYESKKSNADDTNIKYSQETLSADIISWFEWIVCTDDSNEDNQYVIISQSSFDRYWLQDYVENLYYNQYSYWFLSADAEAIKSWPYPQTLNEVVMYGWMTYYDKLENYCYWMNIVTGTIEEYLPLNNIETANSLYELSLYPYDSSSEWVAAEQTISFSWLLVVPDQESSEQYYLNTITQDSKWDAPGNWEELVQSWNGWLLCCLESDIHAKFW
jgi:hypothetical protein